MNKPSHSLSTQAARGATLTLVGQVVRIAIQSIGVVVLARLLLPADFGLVAMVVAIAGFGEVIREMGLGIAAIQARTVTVAQRNNLFWANTLLGVFIGGVFLALAWPMAELYDDDRLVGIAQCISITFVFSGMAAQYRAGLQRDLKYIGVVLADVMSMLIATVAAIAMAVYGLGYWSIVAQQLIQPAVGLIVVAISARWLPGRMRRGQGMRQFMSSGWNIFAYQLLTYASRNIDTVLVGARFGASSAGLYNRAFQLMTVPLGQFLTPSVRIAVSVLSKLQDDIPTFTRYLQRAQNALVFACLSVLALLFGLASPVVALLLGPNWTGVVPLFQILAVAGMFQVLSYPPLWAYLALGYSRENLHQAVAARCALIAAVVVGSFFNLQTVAIGYAAGMALAWPISMFWLARVSPLRVGSLVASACRQVSVFSFGAILLAIFSDLFNYWTAAAEVALGAGVFVIYIGVVMLVWPAFRRNAQDIYLAISRLRSARH